ncbi:MAG: flavodoxin domain-containing protein [Bacilli bacterium]|jgi:menaquinone-dependent protoporphyrinogen IX oxidase
MKKKVIIYTSYHQRNTFNLLQASLPIEEYTWVNLLRGEEKNLALNHFDVVILGSGIYYGKMHKRLLAFIAAQKEELASKTLALVITAGKTPEHYQRRVKRYLKRLKLPSHRVYACLGYDTFGPLRLIGGINKGRPNEEDKERLSAFIKTYDL